MACLTLEEIQAKTERTFALAVLAAYAKRGITVCLGVILTVYLAKRLRNLLAMFEQVKLDKLTPEKAERFSDLLIHVYDKVAEISNCPGVERLYKIPILGKSIISIQDSAIRVEDIIEDLQMVKSKDFKEMISLSISNLEESPRYKSRLESL